MLQLNFYIKMQVYIEKNHYWPIISMTDEGKFINSTEMIKITYAHRAVLVKLMHLELISMHYLLSKLDR